MKNGLLFIFGVFLALFGFVGALLTIIGINGLPRGTFLNKPKPIYRGDSIGVDSKGNIYINTLEHNVIQCFDPEGNFQYGIFVSPEYYTFSLCSDDTIHTLDGITHNIYKYGIMLSSENLTSEEQEEQLMIYYNTKHYPNSSTCFCNGKNYELLNRQLVITDENGKESTLALEVPIWPLRSDTYLTILFIGMGICFYYFCKIAEIKFF